VLRDTIQSGGGFLGELNPRPFGRGDVSADAEIQGSLVRCVSLLGVGSFGAENAASARRWCHSRGPNKMYRAFYRPSPRPAPAGPDSSIFGGCPHANSIRFLAPTKPRNHPSALPSSPGYHPLLYKCRIHWTRWSRRDAKGETKESRDRAVYAYRAAITRRAEASRWRFLRFVLEEVHRSRGPTPCPPRSKFSSSSRNDPASGTSDLGERRRRDAPSRSRSYVSYDRFDASSPDKTFPATGRWNV